MPGEQIDELMHIWASMPKQKGPPPFSGNGDLYGSIDAISEGDAPWTSLLMESAEAATLPVDDPSVPKWKQATYEVLFVIHKYYWTINCLILSSRTILTTPQNWCMEKMVSMFGLIS